MLYPKNRDWEIITKGDTKYGLHGAQIEIKAKEDLSIEDFIVLRVIRWLVGLIGTYWFKKKLEDKSGDVILKESFLYFYHAR